jgi:DNA-binding transcriptional LysR family regulator
MDRFEAMATLLAAVEEGSLSAASRSLGMPLATVSRRVSELEARLRTRLLVRTSRRLSLTEAGAAYVAACRRILDDVDEAERSAAGEYRAPRGDLTLTAPLVFGRTHVQPVILAFLQAYPEINVRLVLADQVMNLVEHHVDVALRIGRLPDSSLTATRAGTVRWVACGSPAYFAARGAPAAPGELQDHDCIAFDGLYAPAAWTFAGPGGEVALPMRPRFGVNTAEAAIDAAKAGAGVTRVLSYQAAEAVRTGELQLVLRDFEPEPLPVSLVYGGGPLLPQKLRAFLDFAVPPLKASLAQAAI